MALPVTIDPNAWGGVTYNPALPLDLDTARDALVGQLQTSFEGTPIPIYGFPNQPDNSWWNGNAIGYVSVAYDRTEYGLPMTTAAMAQERRVDFLILIIARQIAWGSDIANEGVARAMIAVAKSSLTGFRVPGWRNGYFLSESFREQDPQGQIWVYEMRFRIITLELKHEPTYALSILKKLLYYETSGNSAIPVAPTRYVFGPDGVIQLPDTNISAVTVTNVAGTADYNAGVDYTVSRALGQVTLINGGKLSPGETVLVGYSHSDIVTTNEQGGPVPFYPSN